MSSGTNNFTPTPGDWRTGRDFRAYTPINDDGNYGAWPISSHAILYGNRGAHEPWSIIEERLITGVTGPQGLASFPTQQYIPVRTLALNNNVMAREPPPVSRGQWNLQPLTITREEDSKLTHDEQNKALKKLKKEIYNPIPKKMSSRLSLYYRDHAKDILNQRAKEKEEDGKRCAVCLEDFEPKELVMLTPCNHMFHEDCIVPWVKSHGQCPVCRHALFERVGRNAELLLNNNTTNLEADNLLAGELISIIRAMEEAVISRNTAR